MSVVSEHPEDRGTVFEYLYGPTCSRRQCRQQWDSGFVVSFNLTFQLHETVQSNSCWACQSNACFALQMLTDAAGRSQHVRILLLFDPLARLPYFAGFCRITSSEVPSLRFSANSPG